MAKDIMDGEFLVNELNKAILEKKKIKYQLKKDIRFEGYDDKSIEDMAASYAKADKMATELRDQLAYKGLLTDWNNEQE